MEDKSILYKEIFTYCEKYFFDHENPVLAIKNAKFYKEGYDAYGLEDIELKELKYEILDRYELTPTELAELGSLFMRTGKFEFATLAISLLKKHRPRLTREVYEIVKTWFDQWVENWFHADMLCTKITPVFLELKLATLEDFEPWLSSPSKWTRRAVPVTLIYLIGTVETPTLLTFLEPLMRDREKTVQQGITWFLKKLSTHSPKEVEDFVLQYKKKVPKQPAAQQEKKKGFKKPFKKRGPRP